jgi:AraC family transcriptional regulator
MPELAYSPYLEDDVFAFLLAGSALMKMRLPDGIARNERVSPGTLQLLPRQTVFGANWNAPWTYGALQLYRGSAVGMAAATLRGDPQKTELVPTYGFNDPFLYHLGIELANEMRNANPLGPLYADSLANRITLHLLRHYSTGRVVRDLSSGRLTPAQLRLVDEYIHAHLDQKITLADLAARLHLSVPHFERMFRATTYRPPYRYVLELRLERARVLLKNTRLPLADVAFQCGFSSQSHFTAHFTRYAGVSPARFARGVRQ